MDRISGRRAYRAVGTALLAFAAILIAGAAPSAAATYSLSFTGKVYALAGAGGVFGALGVVPGDFVSGTVTIDPFNADTYSDGGHNAAFTQTAIATSFHVEHPGAVDLTIGDTGTGEIVTAGSPASKSGIQFSVDGAKSYLEFRIQTDATGGKLTSLAGLPSSPTGLIALFGGTSPNATGYYSLNGYGTVLFDIDFTVAVTPIPPALPLFASALGGVGFIAWRRRQASTASA